jgi:molybdopterin converting factor small subunit
MAHHEHIAKLGEGGVAAVTARLFAGLERLTRDGRAEQRVSLAQAPTVAALCEALGLARGAAGLLLVNGVHGEETTTLRDGDEVSLFPPVGGG